MERHASAPSRLVLAIIVSALPLLAAGEASAGPRVAAAATLERISRPPAGDPYGSLRATTSGDGRVVAFGSATPFDPRDINRYNDIYAVDRADGQARRVSVPVPGQRALGASDFPRVSADGRRVAFESAAGHLVPQPRDGRRHAYLADLDGTALVGLEVTPSGRLGNGSVWPEPPALSDDGRWAAFSSTSSDLVPGDTNGRMDVFVRDLVGGTTRLVSTGPGGRPVRGYSNSPRLSADGSTLAFVSDGAVAAGVPGGGPQVYLRDLASGATVLVSRGSDGAPGDGWSARPSLSGDGQRVAFDSRSTNLVAGDTDDDLDVYLYDRARSAVTLLSATPAGTSGDGTAQRPAISADGRWVVWESFSTDVLPSGHVPTVYGGADLLLRDLTTGGTQLVDGAGNQADISADGRQVVFDTMAPRAAGDTNDAYDVYLWTRGAS